MTATPMMQMASARAGLDSALAKLNVGGVAGTISIWSGALPATCETADDGTAAHTLSTLTPNSFRLPRRSASSLLDRPRCCHFFGRSP